MIFLKSFSLVAIYLTANRNPIAANTFVFPTERSTKTTTVTSPKFSTETTTTTDVSTKITTATDNLKQNQTESNNEPFCGDLAVGDYCTNPPGYPEENILKAIVSQQGILSSFFEEDVIHFFPPDYEEEFGNVCSAQTDHIMPRAAKNTKGEFQFIVNHPKENHSFSQKVQVVKCVNAGDECGDGAVFDAKTECHQEFLEHKLVAVSKDGTQVVVDTFKFPSCCTCRISRNK